MSQVVSYNYDSWGKLIAVLGTMAGSIGSLNPYRYRGYRYDSETGLYYLQSRYYNPEWGRFINADDTDVLTASLDDIADKNLFAYCHNNSINLKDPNGYYHMPAYGDSEEYIPRKQRKKDRSDDLVKNVKNGLIDMTVGNAAKKVIQDGFTVAINREAVRNVASLNRWFIPNAKSILLVRGVLAAGVLGLISALSSIWKNYHSGYSFSTATKLSMIDFLTASLSIGAGIVFTPGGGLLAGVFIGMVGDFAKDAILKKYNFI